MINSQQGRFEWCAVSGAIFSVCVALAGGCTGETGPTGATGSPGAQGPEGKQGPQGKPGPQGEPGMDGAPGVDGAPGPAGEDGHDGEDGATGPAGAEGPPGDDGEDATPRPVGLSLSVLGRHSTGLFDQGSQEILSYDLKTKRLFSMNAVAQTVDVLDISDPKLPEQIGMLNVAEADARPLGDVTSLSSHQGLLAVAVAANPRTDPGLVLFYDAASLALLGKVQVGPLPDMLTFTPDGKRVVVAIEGEPSPDYSVDPEGAVAVVEVPTAFTAETQIQVRTADFHAYDARAAELRTKGVRISGPKLVDGSLQAQAASASQDFEPEYVSVSADSKRAWVTLQENNAIAVVNLETASIEDVRPLGFKNFNLLGNELDPSDKDQGVHLKQWPVFGMYMPDAIARYEVAGQTYLITANEGDTRVYGPAEAVAYSDVARVSSLSLDPTVFPNATELKAPSALGNLQVARDMGNLDADADYERLYAFGARSFAIWNASTGQLVYESGNEFELITAKRLGDGFNSSHSLSGGDLRSDDKGPEPEGVSIATVEGSTFALITLERVGGIMIYDVTLPESPRFVSYVNTRDLTQQYGGEGFVWDSATQSRVGDLGPEASIYIPASEPGTPGILALGNEVSGTTVLFSVTPLYGVLP